MTDQVVSMKPGAIRAGELRQDDFCIICKPGDPPIDWLLSKHYVWQCLGKAEQGSSGLFCMSMNRVLMEPDGCRSKLIPLDTPVYPVTAEYKLKGIDES